MDTTTIVVLAILVLVGIVAFRYRGRLGFSLKALGIETRLEGEDRAPSPAQPQAEAAKPAEQAPSSSAEASGSGSVAIGRDAKGSTITTNVGQPKP